MKGGYWQDRPAAASFSRARADEDTADTLETCASKMCRACADGRSARPCLCLQMPLFPRLRGSKALSGAWRPPRRVVPAFARMTENAPVRPSHPCWCSRARAVGRKPLKIARTWKELFPRSRGWNKHCVVVGAGVVVVSALARIADSCSCLFATRESRFRVRADGMVDGAEQSRFSRLFPRSRGWKTVHGARCRGEPVVSALARMKGPCDRGLPVDLGRSRACADRRYTATAFRPTFGLFPRLRG